MELGSFSCAADKEANILVFYYLPRLAVSPWVRLNGVNWFTAVRLEMMKSNNIGQFTSFVVISLSSNYNDRYSPRLFSAKELLRAKGCVRKSVQREETFAQTF